MDNASKKVLVVDDEKEVSDLICRYLEKQGLSAQPSYNGQDALALIRQSKPSLIILDVLMPKMDGYELLQFLKQDPVYASIPVIMLTAKKERRDLDKGVTLGADFYLPKPFDLKNLKQFIDLAL